MFASFGYLFYL